MMEESYINLNGLTTELGIKNILMHTQVWELYLSHNFKISLIRSLDILRALILEMTDKMPVQFSVDLGEEMVNLIADYRLSDKSILIRFDGVNND